MTSVACDVDDDDGDGDGIGIGQVEVLCIPAPWMEPSCTSSSANSTVPCYVITAFPRVSHWGLQQPAKEVLLHTKRKEEYLANAGRLGLRAQPSFLGVSVVRQAKVRVVVRISQSIER